MISKGLESSISMWGPQTAAFEFGRRSGNTLATYSAIYALINLSPVYVQGDTLATIHYTQLYSVSSRYITSNYQLTTREVTSSSNLSSLADYIQPNMLVADTRNPLDSTGTPFPLNILSNLERLWRKHWFVILSMKKVNMARTISAYLLKKWS